jgi:hypothetical protein
MPWQGLAHVSQHAEKDTHVGCGQAGAFASEADTGSATSKANRIGSDPDGMGLVGCGPSKSRKLAWGVNVGNRPAAERWAISQRKQPPNLSI